MDLGLNDRVYVVTGATRGLGQACAEQLVAEGARLVLCGAEEEALRATAAALGGSERAIPVTGDLSDPGWETCLVAAAIARYGRLDGALLAVDTATAGTPLDLEDGLWRNEFEASFLGPLRLCRSVAAQVSYEGGSLVLVLSSDSTHESVAGTALDSGMRPALTTTARALAEELGPRNIRVNALVSGGVETADGRALEGRIPLQRFGEPLEFARPAVFLLSPAASYVTGSVLTVDGGLTRA